jgi:hypothetical protein
VKNRRLRRERSRPSRQNQTGLNTASALGTTADCTAERTAGGNRLARRRRSPALGAAVPSAVAGASDQSSV